MNKRKETTKLRRRREEKLQLTLAEVSERANIGTSELSHYERGLGRQFSEEKESKLAEVYALTVEEMRRAAGYKKVAIWNLHKAPRSKREVA